MILGCSVGKEKILIRDRFFIGAFLAIKFISGLKPMGKARNDNY